MNFLGVSNSDSKILNWIESWSSWQYSSLPTTMFEFIKKKKTTLPENTTNHLYKFAPSLLFSGSSSLRRLQCWPTSWCGTCLRLSRGRSTGTCCFTASSSQCRRWVRCRSLCCSWLECALMSLTTPFFIVLQCFHVPYSALTMFISKDQKERDSATAYRTSAPQCGQNPFFHRCCSCCCWAPFLCISQAWQWRCWEQFWAPQSRDRS